MSVFEVLQLVGRMLLGAVLLVAGIAKMRDRTGFAASVRAFGLVPRSWSRGVATVLPVVELACGILLLTGFAVRTAAVAATGLLVVFTVGIAANLTRGRTAPCACFGAATARRLGPSALVRNLLILVAGALVLVGTVTGVPDSLQVADGLGALLITGLLVVGWQLLLTTITVSSPARAVAAGARR